MSNSPANAINSRPIAMLAIAVALGVLGEYLFSPGVLGLNALLWTAALCGSGFLAARLQGLTFRGEGRWLLGPALLFAAFVAWRSSPVLQAMNIAAVVAIISVASFRLREGKVRLGGVTEYLFAALLAATMTVIGALELIFRRIAWRSSMDSASFQRTIPFLRAVAFGVPLFLVFAVLLASSDAVFSNAFTGIFEVDAGAVVAHAGRAVIWAWIAAGFLHGALFDSSGPIPHAEPPAALRFGPIEVGTVLGLLDFLFLAFVAIQVRYLFGGSAHVEVTDGLTYAEYARRGFFELLAVATLVLPVVLGVHWLLRDSSPGLRIGFRVLATTMILLIFAIIASALRRMDAYVDEFGLTQLRLYSTAAMLWLVFVFGWLLATVLREQRKRFAFGAFSAGLAVVAGLNVLNPDALIVHTNLDRAERRNFDAAYVLRLSPDATPTMVAGLNRMELESRCRTAKTLANRDFDSGPWQTWNASRERAKDVVAAEAQALSTACEPPP